MPVPVNGLGQHVRQVSRTLENRRGLGEGTLTFEDVLQLESHVDESADGLVGLVYPVISRIVFKDEHTVPGLEFRSSIPAIYLVCRYQTGTQSLSNGNQGRRSIIRENSPLESQSLTDQT